MNPYRKNEMEKVVPETGIDGCVVINLPQRTDRWEVFQKQLPTFQSLGLQPERIDAVYGRHLPGYGEMPWFRRRHSEKRDQAWAGKAGCTLSHRQAIATAKARGWKTVLILEDDVAFEPCVRDQWPQLLEAMRTLPDNWITIYLFGSHPAAPIRVVKEYTQTSCYEIGGAIGAVAYIINGRYFDALLEKLPTPQTIWGWSAQHKTIDRWYSRQFVLLGPVYAMVPFGVNHRETLSDATTAGEAYQATNFLQLQVTRQLWCGVTCCYSYWINRTALVLSIVRKWMKRWRGL